MEQTENRTRSAIYEEIYKIVKQIPTKDVYGDAMDAPSASVLLEQLFKKWQQHGVSGSASGAVDKTVSVDNVKKCMGCGEELDLDYTESWCNDCI